MFGIIDTYRDMAKKSDIHGIKNHTEYMYLALSANKLYYSILGLKAHVDVC